MLLQPAVTYQALAIEVQMPVLGLIGQPPTWPTAAHGPSRTDGQTDEGSGWFDSVATFFILK